MRGKEHVECKDLSHDESVRPMPPPALIVNNNSGATSH